jgi:Mce-associated membrane protein
VHGEGVGDGAGLTRPGSSSLDPESAGDEFDDFDDGYQPRPWWQRTSTLVVLVVCLFVVSGAVTAWLRISDLQQRVDTLEAQTFASEEARQVAILLATDLATYDYRDLGGNFRHVAAQCTADFAGQLRQLTEELGPELQQNRAIATATVRSAGVVRADEGRAVIAVFVDQTVTNTSTPEPRTERSRMELTLLNEGGTWRLDQAGEL